MLLLPVDCEKCNDSEKAGPYVSLQLPRWLALFTCIAMSVWPWKEDNNFSLYRPTHRLGRENSQNQFIVIITHFTCLLL